MREKRRNLDWIQFGILLCAIFALIVGTLVEHGRVLQELQDHGESLRELKQDIKSLDEKIDSKTQALQDRITQVQIERNIKQISDSQRKEEP